MSRILNCGVRKKWSWKWSSTKPKWLKKNLKIQSAWPEIEPWFFATSRQNALRMSTKFNIRSASYSDSTHWCSLVPRPVRAIWVTRAGEFSRQTWRHIRNRWGRLGTRLPLVKMTWNDSYFELQIKTLKLAWFGFTDRALRTVIAKISVRCRVKPGVFQVIF